MKKRNLTEINTDDVIFPFEQEEIDEAKKIMKLEAEYLKREKQTLLEEEKRKELEKKKITKQEAEELEDKASNIKKFYTLDYWMRCWNRVSYHNEISGQAMFHVALGQALNTFKITLEDDSELDWRLHYLLIQDSGSGKGRGINMASRVFRHPKFLKIEQYDDTKPPTKRKFKCHKLGRMNAASLINTFEVNQKGEIVKDENGLEQVKLGVLESNDFIFSEEARQILTSNTEAFEIQEILMTGMETIGSVNNIYTKQLTNYKEECQTRCTASFALTTRPFGKIKQTLVESGLFQRLMFYPRKLTYEDRINMQKKSSFAFKSAKTKTPFSKEFDKMIEELNKVCEFAHYNYIDFDIDKIDDLLSYLHEKMMWFTDDVENTVPTEDNRYILQSFVSRFKDNMVIMAFHSAAMRYSKIVERQDLQYAFDFFSQLYEAQKVWVSLNVEEDKDVKNEDRAMRMAITQYLKNDLNEATTFPELVKFMAKEFQKDYVGMSYHIKKFARGNYPLIKIEDNPDNQRMKKVLLIRG
jgi:hypothetical protein